ncbi:MAG: hydantoinase/oxoprolinase family protein, partial [Pseudomonadota bacterium]|nr:hydantoinase/oxoprolinase family protein [Pseudomonadota bacterium]
MRFACDTGGTFTDLIVEDDTGSLSMYKAATTPDDPIVGALNALRLAAEDRDIELSSLLGKGEMFIHGTTHAINAIITGNTAKTGFFTTKGHPDILVIREGGRIEPFNFRVPYPKPYVPRSLTFEVPERINSDGKIVVPMEEEVVLELLHKANDLGIEAISVCFLWSIANSAHEVRLGKLIEEHLPGIPFSLSHNLNPALREYRRASATSIDASLKPLMTDYLNNLRQRLNIEGFRGRTLVLTSQGGMIEAEEMATKPIHAINSGPSMAPIAGRYYAQLECDEDSLIIADTGGTTYDVSLVRKNRIPKTRETWIGQAFRGHMTGFPSIDIKSVGAGGGSIARVDEGGILHVGPGSAGAVPGPVCYDMGGSEATLTDACLVLGYIDPSYFLGGEMNLNTNLARTVIEDQIAKPLGVETNVAAASIVNVATENMVQAISEITVNQGIDPAESLLIGGGGAAGLNSTFIARRLGCPRLLIPVTGAGLSAYGAAISDLTSEFRSVFFATSDNWELKSVNSNLKQLEARAKKFIDGPGKGAVNSNIEYTVEARYAGQV